MKKYLAFFLIFMVLEGSSQTAQRMDFENYNPPSTLVVPTHKLTKAKFPFIDVHNHQEEMPDMDLGTLITDMDKMNMKIMVNLSGRNGDQLKRSVQNIKGNYQKDLLCLLMLISMELGVKA